MMTPYFSIIIPAYNVGDFITETVGSVINQTLDNFEIIVINDGSSDNTSEKLALINDKRLIVHHIENHGVSYARNLGISLARGEYIAFLDGDDIWHSTHLQSAAVFFKLNPEVSWWTSQSYVANSIQNEVPHAEVTGIYNYYGIPSIYANSSTIILHASSAKKLLPLFPKHLSYAEDWAAWTTFAQKHPMIGFFPVKDVLYRYREGSATKTNPINQIFDRIMGFPHHMSMLNSKGGSSELSLTYFRIRTVHSWMTYFAFIASTNCENELRAQRQILGTFLYLIIKTQTLSLSLINRAFCQLLGIIDKILAKKIKRTK